MIEIQDIKSQTTIGFILEHYNVKKGNGNSSWLCPFHKDGSPSFIAQPEGHAWKCTSCDIGGDEIEFIQKAEGYDKARAIEHLKKLLGIVDIEEKDLDFKLGELQAEHIEYLKKRGINPARAVKKFGIKGRIINYKKRGAKQAVKSVQICFPEPDLNNKIKSFKYIDINDKDIQGTEGVNRGTKTYPAARYKDIKVLIYVAGQWDLMIFDEYFEKEFPDKYKSTAIRTGSAGEKNVPKDIAEIAKYPELEKVYIFLDNDPDGIKGSEKLALEVQKLGKQAIIKYWPEEFPKGFDVNDWLYKSKEHHGTVKQLFKMKEKIFNPLSEEEKKQDEKDERSDDVKAIDEIHAESEIYQIAVILYLIGNNESIGPSMLDLSPSDFLNLKYRRYYNILIDKYISIGLCDADKFVEVEPEAINEFLNVKINIRNDIELKEYIKKIKSLYFRNNLFVQKADIERICKNHKILSDEEIVSEVNQAQERFHSSKNNTGKKSITMYDAMKSHVNDPQPFVEMLPLIKYPLFNTYLGGGMPYGKLSIIAARPSVGKTTFMSNMVELLGATELVGVYSLEMEPNELARITFALNVNHSLNYISENFAPAFIQILDDSIKEYHKNIHIITGFKDPADIAQDIRMKHKKYGMRIFVLDHFHLLKPDLKFKDVRLFYSYWSTYFSELAKELGIMFILLCQLNRSVESRGSAKPKMSDLKESGSLEQDAYNIIFLYTEDSNQQQSSKDVKLLLGKARGGTANQDILFEYIRSKASFKELRVA